MEHDNTLMIFGTKDNFDFLLAIATNIPMRLVTWFCGPGSQICLLLARWLKLPVSWQWIWSLCCKCFACWED